VILSLPLTPLEGASTENIQKTSRAFRKKKCSRNSDMRMMAIGDSRFSALLLFTDGMNQRV
jgi:hypothetical protein